jgi:Uma2 family endonuclease
MPSRAAYRVQIPISATDWPAEAGEFPRQGTWTYEDYRRLPDDGRRYEVLRGVLYVPPAPNPKHQAALRNLSFLLGLFLQQHPVGSYFFAPLDVILPQKLATPVQPDLIFLARERRHLLKERFLEGAPDLIVEILSSSNQQYDRKTKLDLYAEAGVREAWMADPKKQTVEVFVLRNGAYRLLGKFGPGEAVRSEILPGFEPLVDEICAD